MTTPADKVQTVDLFDRTWRINNNISEFALLEFADAASDGETSESMEGLASLYRFVKECIHPDDLPQFLATARKNRATGEDLMAVPMAAFGVKAERPTGLPADSSAGQTAIEPKSVPSADVKGSRLDGRPDLRLMLQTSAAA